VVATEVGDFVGRVALTPRRREPYADPYDIVRVVTEEDEREEDRNRELGREMRVEARKLARDYGSRASSLSGATSLWTASTSRSSTRPRRSSWTSGRSRTGSSAPTTPR
jgi:hypothetical protein